MKRNKFLEMKKRGEGRKEAPNIFSFLLREEEEEREVETISI